VKGAASGAGRWGLANDAARPAFAVLRRGLARVRWITTNDGGSGAGGPRDMTKTRFIELVEDALRGIPRRFRDAMKNVAVVVEDEPSQEVLDDLEMEPGDTLFGLYHGTPLTQRDSTYGNTLPDRISIYQRPIEDACEDEEDIRMCVAETVIHEFGHYFGLSEEEIEEIEEKYWRDR
jgi:predicted Zn-dependent protease with MMP-like domain